MNMETDLQALFSPEVIQNPYPLYQRIRSHGELLHVPNWNNAFALSIDAVNALFKHRLVSANRLGEMSPDWFATKLLQPMMLFHDAPSHSRLRSLVSQAFTPKAIAETREAIAVLTDELLGEHAKKGGDFVSNVAVLLPMLVIAKLLGLEHVDRTSFRRWATALAITLDGSTLAQADQAQLAKDTDEMFAYFRESANDMRVGNKPGVLGAMARAEADGEKLSSDELLSNAVLLLGAGFETTTNLIAGSVLEFSKHPEQWQLLRERPEFIPNAVEECLRFVSPVAGTDRLVKENLEWRGQVLPKDSHVSLMLAAANRDPKAFIEPEKFDITRSNASQHVAFASGPHYCLGAPLARLEMQVFLERLALKYPEFSVPEQRLEYNPNFTLRGLKRLEVTLTHKSV
jgi:cytochrome P450